MGDTEVNQQEAALKEANLTTMAEICIDAPAKIKETISLYDPCNTTAENMAELNTCIKDDITDALEHLNVVMIWKDYLKPNCVLELVCRIQNLLPNKCNTCDVTYATHMQDPPILPCEKCGNEPHKRCLAEMLGIDSDELSADIVKQTLNPLGFEGLHYICHQCIDTTLPGKKSGMTRAAMKRHDKSEQTDKGKQKASASKKATNTAVSFLIPDEENMLITTENQESTGETIHSSQISSGSSSSTPIMQSIGEDTKHVDTEEIPPDDTKPPCRNFMKGNCRHGMSGKTDGICKFYHPKTCKKLLKHGTKAGIGCNKGKQCEFYHPKMCPLSIAKSICYSRHCTLKHVRGTKRLQPPDKGKKPEIKGHDHETDGHNDSGKDFLEALHGMQADIMRSVEEKLSAITGAIQQMQASMIAPQYLPMQHSMPIPPQLQRFQQQQQQQQPYLQNILHPTLFNQQPIQTPIPPLQMGQSIQATAPTVGFKGAQNNHY